MSSVVWRKKKKKKLATVIVGLFSLKENAPTKKSFFLDYDQQYVSMGFLMTYYFWINKVHVLIPSRQLYTR